MPISEVAVSTQRGFFLKAVPAGQQAFILSRGIGGVGASGDRVQRLLVNVTTANAATITMLDGFNTFPILVAGPNVPPGPQIIELGVYSQNGAWSIQTGNGVTLTAVGEFSP